MASLLREGIKKVGKREIQAALQPSFSLLWRAMVALRVKLQALKSSSMSIVQYEYSAL